MLDIKLHDKFTILGCDTSEIDNLMSDYIMNDWFSARIMLVDCLNRDRIIYKTRSLANIVRERYDLMLYNTSLTNSQPISFSQN